ncbi:MAG: hypothetical protein IKS31_01880 [Clostridia bacterium]|nr:hypothetical protein [Clostridia bacterium]MBR4457687.1 hypothetical protein [Clostridia bacterium]
MYKRQMKLQRILCILCVATSALVFVYALGIMTDLYDMLFNQLKNYPESLDESVTGARIYADMQPFNHLLLRLSIGLLLLALTLLLTNTHLRRRYYISNYISIGLNVIANVAMAVWAHLEIAAFKVQYLTTVDFEQLRVELRPRGNQTSLYTDSTFWFDIHYLVCGLCLAVAVLLILNTIWKIRLEKQERTLLDDGGKAVQK